MNAKIIISLIFAILLFCIIVFMFVFAIRFDYLYKKQKKDFIVSLNEHDKSVVLDYENCLLVRFRDVFKKHINDVKN